MSNETEVVFQSKYLRFRTYDGKRPIQFEGGYFKTKDPKFIEILDKIPHVRRVESLPPELKDKKEIKK